MEHPTDSVTGHELDKDDPSPPQSGSKERGDAVISEAGADMSKEATEAATTSELSTAYLGGIRLLVVVIALLLSMFLVCLRLRESQSRV